MRGEARCAAELCFLAARMGERWYRHTGIECVVKRGAAFSVCCTLNLCQKSLLEDHKVYSRW